MENMYFIVDPMINPHVFPKMIKAEIKQIVYDIYQGSAKIVYKNNKAYLHNIYTGSIKYIGDKYTPINHAK